MVRAGLAYVPARQALQGGLPACRRPVCATVPSMHASPWVGEPLPSVLCDVISVVTEFMVRMHASPWVGEPLPSVSRRNLNVTPDGGNGKKVNTREACY
jgi:hypothetical protein